MPEKRYVLADTSGKSLEYLSSPSEVRESLRELYEDGWELEDLLIIVYQNHTQTLQLPEAFLKPSEPYAPKPMPATTMAHPPSEECCHPERSKHEDR